MRSLTVRDGWGDKVQVARCGPDEGILRATSSQTLHVGVLLKPKKLREFGQACIQIADELDNAQ